MAENQSLRAPKEEDREREEEESDEEEESESEEEEEDDDDDDEEKPLSKLRSSLPCIAVPDRSSAEAAFRVHSSQSETLTASSLFSPSENDHDSGCPSFSQLLAGAMASPAANSPPVGGLDMKPTISTPPASLDPAGFKGQFGMSHQEVLASVTAQAQAQMELQAGYLPSSSELSPVSVIQSTSPAISSAPPQQGLIPVHQDNNVCTPEVNRQNSSDRKTKPAHAIVKTPPTDGYNWRKYGQKQVKSNESSRSYYRCTFVNCHAKKKVERCDHSGRVIEIIYKGRHNHDPPRKIRCTKTSRFVSSAGPGGGSGTIDNRVIKLNDSDPSTSRREPRHATPGQQLHSSIKRDGDAGVRAEEEHGDEPDPKRRMKESSAAYSSPLFKTAKEPKIVVQAASDVGISGDGYRWRKYGQKMVKGNPNPRSYYKCTSAGCPVRKHVERSIDDTTAIIITYEGKHDHDMPVPKKRHGPPSAALLIAAAAAMNSAQLKKSGTSNNRKPSIQWSMDMEGELAGEKALELGGEKALESARTLLSIGIELKPY